MGKKYSGRFDDHPDMIALCMKCRKKDCFGRCADWVAVYKRLENEEINHGGGLHEDQT